MATPEQIRKRHSYRFFQKLADIIESKRSTGNKLKRIYEMMDQRKQFGSQKNSEYAKEAIDLLITDNEF
jgi:hypothetical protein